MAGYGWQMPTSEERETLDRRAKSVDGKTCQRCKKSLSSGKCQVPHPPHLQTDCGSLSDVNGRQEFSQCQACGESITTLYKGKKPPVIVQGPKFCWNGKHRKMALVWGDERFVNNEVLSFKVTSKLQTKIDKALSGDKQKDVRILNISSNGCYDENITASVCHTMKNLTKVQLLQVNIKKLHLNKDITPMVEELELEGLPDDCDFNIVLPTLKKVDISYYHPTDGGDAIKKMLQTAKKLETFRSYKLIIFIELKFASNDLESITVYRSDCLSKFSMWAPKLKHLSLRACYDINKITILKSFGQLSKKLPKDHKMSTFSLDLTNAVLSDRAIQSLRESGRCEIPANYNRFDMDF